MSHWIADERMEIMPFQREDGKWVWVTSRRCTFVFGATNNAAVFVVPPMFESDLGSIPAWGRWLVSPSDPDCAQAYVLHDYINSLTGSRPPGFDVVSSVEAAAVLYDALRCNGVAVWKASLIFAAVVAGIAKGER